MLLHVLWGIAVIIFIFLAISTTKDVRKKKKLQQQTKYNFERTKGRYTFYYSVKGFRKEDGMKIKIISWITIGIADIAHAQKNKFEGMRVFINGKEISNSLTVDGYNVLAELTIPNEYINENSINVDIKIKANWYLAEKNIEDELVFNYEEKI